MYFYLIDFNHCLLPLYYSVFRIINFDKTVVFYCCEGEVSSSYDFLFCGTVQST
jgi:hypothetical protein